MAKNKLKISDVLPESRAFVKNITEERPAPDIFNDSDNADKEKRMIMWSGVVFFMLSIVVIWIWNFKSIVSSMPASDVEKNISWKENKLDFLSSLEEIRVGWEKLQSTSTASVSPEADVLRAASLSATTSPAAVISAEEARELKNKLENNQK